MIVFTLCSNNYLPMARVLGESLLRHNPGWSFVIGLVDRRDPTIDYAALKPFEVLPVEDIGIPEFEEMVMRYRIIELNTAVKPFYFQFLFQRLLKAGDAAGKICYLDPDISVYSSLATIDQTLDRASILLTPHVLSPVPIREDTFGEQIFLNYGIYNLGFLGLRWSPATESMLVWWAERLAELCLAHVEKGIYVDQLWLNHAPLFFAGVEISRDPGLNVAYWNLHERHLEQRADAWFINGTQPVRFYHFSSFDFGSPDSLGRYSVRYDIKSRPEMRPFFDDYRRRLAVHDYEKFRRIPCAFVRWRDDRLEEEKRQYYLRHPFAMIADYWKHPGRLWTAIGRALRPKKQPVSSTGTGKL